VQIVIQFLMIISNFVIQKLMPSENNTSQDRRMQTVASFYIVSRLFNIFWVIWVIIGIIWTFQSRSCASSTGSVYMVCFILAIWHLVILGIPVVLCCCSIPIMVGIYLLCPNVFGKRAPRSASKRLIKSNTTLKSYKQGLVAMEDANCAICLCEYEEGDDVRFLHCDHHFHSDCIVTWLTKNKSCPFCKKDIDYKEKPVKKTKEPETIEEDEVELVRRNAVV